jgi:hypothetical protein
MLEYFMDTKGYVNRKRTSFGKSGSPTVWVDGGNKQYVL